MKSKLLDPVSNAKSIGNLLLVVGAYNLLKLPSVLSKGDGDIVFVVFYLFNYLTTIVVGLGLRNSKLWGLYALFLKMVVSSIYSVLFILPKGGLITNIYSVSLVINLLLFLWFFPARNKFSK